eukprot:3025682-Pyramimonas_sp.AAC.1
MGCGGPDSSAQYWYSCPAFQYCIALAIQPSPFDDSPIVRLGACSPSRRDFEPAVGAPLLFNAATASSASPHDPSAPLQGV